MRVELGNPSRRCVTAGLLAASFFAASLAANPIVTLASVSEEPACVDAAMGELRNPS